MQKLWLKNFEFHINPLTWNAAQDLVQSGGVYNLQEVEKHFWVAQVGDGEFRFEVEVMITPHKIKAYTCECWSAGRRLMCAHIAAVLFKVRQFLEQKAEARAARESANQPEETGRLTVQRILDQAEREQLAEFVRNYARRDRDFALALKTWFAGNLPGTGNPFTLVLEAALPRALRQGTRELREPDLRRLKKTLDDLATQTAHAVDQGDTQTVFFIGSAILTAVTGLLVNAEGMRQEQLTQYCRAALHKILQLPPEHLSPELREQRQGFLLEYALKSPPPELQRELLQFLGPAASDETIFRRIREAFDQTPFPAPPIVLHLFLTALCHRNMPEAVSRVLDDYTERPARVKEAVAELYYLHCWQAVFLAGEHFLNKEVFNAGQRREVEDMLLFAAEKTGDRARQIRYVRNRYSQTGHPEFFQRLKILAGADWPAERERLLSDLQASGNSDRLALLFAAEGNLDALENLLEKRLDFSLIRQYEHLFWPDRKNVVRDYYITLLSGYLSNHFGRQAAEHVREQLTGLLHKGQQELVIDIIRTLTTRFADRPSLPDELAELFPKSKRRAVLPIWE